MDSSKRGRTAPNRRAEGREERGGGVVGGRHSLYATTSNVVDVAKDSTQDAGRMTQNATAITLKTSNNNSNNNNREQHWRSRSNKDCEDDDDDDDGTKIDKIFWQANKNILHRAAVKRQRRRSTKPRNKNTRKQQQQQCQKMCKKESKKGNNKWNKRKRKKENRT